MELTKYLLFIMMSMASLSQGQVPSFFKEVDQLLWVVKDVDHVVDSWNELGFDQVNKLGEVKGTLGSETVKLKVALANVGGFRMVWIEPGQDKSVLSDFLEAHGDGVLDLVHRLESREAMQQELERLSGLKVAVLGRLSIPTPLGSLEYVLMDTKERGKYGLAYIANSPADKVWNSLDPGNEHDLKIRQYAFAIKDPEPVSQFWNSLGFPEIELTESVPRDGHYRGQGADLEMTLGWQRHGSIVYEWCIPTKGPTVYQDFMDVHGEGVQHIGLDVEDIDQVIQDFSSKGYTVSMSGAWGEEGKKGSGRFAYVDLEEAGGVAIELLWSYRE